MTRLNCNLARTPHVDAARFALRAAPLLLLALLLAALAAAVVSGRRERSRLGVRAAGEDRRRIQDVRRDSQVLRREIERRRRELGGRLAAANRLIERKSFSFLSRLDFLEQAAGAGIRVRSLSLENQRDSRLRLAVSARSLPELFAFYKKLSPYGLAIDNETQAQDDYRVTLSVKVPDEGL